MIPPGVVLPLGFSVSICIKYLNLTFLLIGMFKSAFLDLIILISSGLGFTEDDRTGSKFFGILR